MTTFSERLRTLRRDAGLSQGELAGEELSASYISLLEAGKRSPSGEVVNLLAVRLGCSTTQLLEGKSSEREQRIELELAYARLAVEHGESQDARVRMEQLLAEEALPARVADQAGLLLGRACEHSGDLPAAARALLPLFQRAKQGLSHLPVSEVGIALCRCYLDSGDLNRATRTGEEALTAARARGLSDTDEYFRLAATVMYAYTNLGDFLHARAWADDLIAEAERTGQRAGQAALYWNAAIIAEHEGRLTESLHLCDRALAVLGELDNTRDFARLRLAVAEILMVCDPPQVPQAEDLLRRVHDDLSDLGSPVDRAEWAYTKASVLLHQGNPREAEDLARESVDLLDSHAPAERVHALTALGDALTAQGRDAEATEVHRDALVTLAGEPTSRALALLWRDLAERIADSGDLVTAVRAYRKALDSAGVRDRGAATRSAIHQLRSQPWGAVLDPN